MYKISLTHIVLSKGDIMGLLSRLKVKDKEEGKAWLINKQRGYVELEENYIKLIVKFPKAEHIIFYKDIVNIERKKDIIIELKTVNESYRIVPVGFSEIKQELSDNTYIALLEKIGEYK